MKTIGLFKIFFITAETIFVGEKDQYNYFTLKRAVADVQFIKNRLLFFMSLDNKKELIERCF